MNYQAEIQNKNVAGKVGVAVRFNTGKDIYMVKGQANVKVNYD